MTYVVGIGTSAEGRPALKAFFSEVQLETDIAFVVVTEVCPNGESLLYEAVSHLTKLPVEVIKDGDPVRPGVVYVAPEGSCLSIKTGHLRLLKTDPALREDKPIDAFFNALAVDQKERAVGIVLSVGSCDATIGLRTIKEHGGITFAQLKGRDGPEQREIPESQATSAYVDFALRPERMPHKLQELQAAAAAISAGLRGEALAATEAERKRMQADISELLHYHTGRNFAGYKSKTFFRRVARRMQIMPSATPEAYLERLRSDPIEVMTLFHDMLIGVTTFFRDESAFEALSAHVMPLLVAKRGSEDSIRLWVPGCATGEEAYSLAILIREHVDGLPVRPKVQIFATDIDTRALSFARAGRFPGPLLKSVSEKRKARFFRQDGENWDISPEIRDMCIFSAHSLTSDLPFSQMDLVSCRNLLIYFGQELQHRVIPTLQYALKPSGILFLGISESLGNHHRLFAAIDKKHRIFKSLRVVDRRSRIPIPLEELRKVGLRFDPTDVAQRTTSQRLRQQVEHQILERHSPAHIVVNTEGNIIFFSARTQKYFDTPRGTPSQHLFDLVRRELRQDLRSALRESLETGRPTLRQAVLLEEDSAFKMEMVVEPLNNNEKSEKLCLIIFRLIDKNFGNDRKDSYTNLTEMDADASARELRELYERLNSIVEQYETTLEELNDSNEELISINEELQSTNEELEASKEEMQSLTEEVSTVNAELNDKLDELEQSNTDLWNLYSASGILSVFLDAEMMIRNFTPAAATFFKLRKSDIGRPLTDLASTTEFPELKEDFLQVLKTGKQVEHRLYRERTSGHFLLRCNPYMDKEMITGVVINLFDVTKLIEAEIHQNLLTSEAEIRAVQMKEISDAHARKARLMAVLAHDLRTPLVAMLSGIDFLHGERTKEAKESISDRLRQEGHGMLTLIDDVLELARLSAGEVKLRPQSFSPLDLLKQVQDLVLPAALRNGTQVKLKASAMPLLLGDITSLRRILMNFATNAVKASPGGSVQLSAMRNKTGSLKNMVTFVVSDTGRGIAANDIPRLFRDFGMLERDEIDQDGTGLGLAICRRLASAINGDLGVDSTLGKGSRFWLKVTLPEADSAVPTSGDKYDDTVDVLTGLRVLVADDHELLRQLTCAKLTTIGMLPTGVADGEDAVSMAEAQEFDLILMDLQMPRLGGDKAAYRIRHGGGPSARARIIGLTAHQPPEVAVMLSNLAFDSCLPKPLDLRQLAALIQGVSPPEPVSATKDGFDTDKLRELRDIDGGVVLLRALKSFSAEIEAIRIELPALIDRRDTSEMGRLVHKIIGFGDTLGARTLSAELRKFEDLIRAKDNEALEAALNWIDDLLVEAGAQICQFSVDTERF